MPQTFTWFPDANHSASVEPSVSSARFGDGYEQRVENGINNMPETWSLTFTGTRVEIKAIDDFLKSHAGARAFLWTTPDEDTGKFICRRWNKGRDRAVKASISCDFVQVFE